MNWSRIADAIVTFLIHAGHQNPYAHTYALEVQRMPSTTITLTFRWPMGHRILGLSGGGEKCRNVHGHNWTADIELPNDDGLLEFGQVKTAVGDWIGGALDHGFAVAHDDPFRDYLETEDLKHIALDGPPTTERLAGLIAHQTETLIGIRPIRVHLVEGYRNAATWTAA